MPDAKRVLAGESAEAGQPVVSFLIPINTVSALNVREHWADRAARVKRERTAARMMCPPFNVPCVVKLVRYSAGRLDDDNLRGALKGVRDGIAEKLGIDDADPRVSWEYDQKKCCKGERYVIVTLRGRKGDL